MRFAKTIGRPQSTYRGRALALLVVHVLGFLVLGSAVIMPGIPDDEWSALDRWLRTAVFAIVRPTNVTPVTYVDIDDALYRDDWGMPTVTPRDKLLTMLAVLTNPGATNEAAADASSHALMIVVDIDLAWGDSDPVLASFLENYAGPEPLVFVRHFENSAGGIREIGTPYDAVFAANSRWLQWAHAYFLSDADGVLREWLPWLAICTGGQTVFLPAVATLVAGQETAPDRPDTECPGIDDLDVYPIIYTEEFGFASRDAGTDADVGLQFFAAGGPARKLPAKYLLNETGIDRAALLANRVVVLGGSHTAGQDLRLTPLGVLPGAVVQANTILHASPQLESAQSGGWSQRAVVIVLFGVLCLVAFPVAASAVILIAAITAGVFSNYAIFGQVQLAALLFVQFRVLVWIAEPFWTPVREYGWRILIADYLRDEEK